MLDDAVAVAVKDQVDAGLDVITDGEQTRLDFNLSFYGFLEGLAPEPPSRRRFGPPGHDQRGKHQVVGELAAPRGLGTVEDFRRLQRIAPAGVGLEGERARPVHAERTARAQRPVSRPLGAGRGAGADRARGAGGAGRRRLRGDLRRRAVDELLRAPRGPAPLRGALQRHRRAVRGRTRLSTHLCFGNYKGRAVAPRSYACLFPAFLDAHVDEMHVEMASREFAELDVIETIAQRMDVAVGIIDVKSYYVETPEDVAARVRRCLAFARPERLAFAPDCGLSQTARWAARRKLANMVEGVRRVRAELGLA